MCQAVFEGYRVLKSGGDAVFVVGNSSMEGRFILNSEIVKSLALSAGFDLSSEHEREIPANRRYMPPPKIQRSGDSMNDRMRTEVVLKFRK